MVAGGIQDVFVSNEVVAASKIDRLVALAAQGEATALQLCLVTPQGCSRHTQSMRRHAAQALLVGTTDAEMPWLGCCLWLLHGRCARERCGGRCGAATAAGPCSSSVPDQCGRAGGGQCRAGQVGPDHSSQLRLHSKHFAAYVAEKSPVQVVWLLTHECRCCCACLLCVQCITTVQVWCGHAKGGCNAGGRGVHAGLSQGHSRCRQVCWHSGEQGCV